MRYFLFFLLTSSISINGVGQVQYGSGGKPYMAVFCGGYDLSNNQNTNSWLSGYGVRTSSVFSFNYGFKLILPWSRTKKNNLLVGGGFNKSLCSYPDRNDLTISLLVGRSLMRKKINIITLLEFGDVDSQIKFDGTIPAPLLQLNSQGGHLSENAFWVNPNIIVSKIFYPYTVGVQLGCQIYEFPSAWKYNENGSQAYVKVPYVPNSSIFHPYISILLGFDAGH